MALPQATQDVIDNVKEAEAETARAAALAQVKAGSTTQAVAKPAAGSPEAIGKAVQAIAQVQGAKAGDPIAFLAELGITDVVTDFTSFPTVTLNNESFSTDEHKNFGTEFECVYMFKKDVQLFKGDLGRDKEPELVYSDDGLHCNKDGKPVASYIEDWKARNITWEQKTYTMVIVQMVDGPHEGEICQIQVSPASRGKLSGYLMQMGLKRINPTEVITKVGIGKEVGSGVKAFTPYTFHLKS